jgi:glycosyltransferase involved in cell wall biosynthesis
VITVLTTVHWNALYRQAIARFALRNIKISALHCDDGSTDGTADFLLQKENQDILAVTSLPIGRGRALNLGASRCQTELLAILDADDVASSRWLAAMAGIMESNPDIAVLSCCGVLSKEEMDVEMNRDIRAYQLSPEMFLYRNPVHHSGTLIRMQVLREIGGYDESRQSLFDYELWVRLLMQGKQIWRVDNGFIFKRIHAGQHFERKKRLHYLLGTYKIRRSVSKNLLHGRAAMIPALLFLYGLLPRTLRHWVYSRRNMGVTI